MEQHIIVELDEILNISLSKGVICSVKINMDNFDKLFNINGRTYDFSIRLMKRYLMLVKAMEADYKVTYITHFQNLID